MKRWFAQALAVFLTGRIDDFLPTTTAVADRLRLCSIAHSSPEDFRPKMHQVFELVFMF